MFEVFGRLEPGKNTEVYSVKTNLGIPRNSLVPHRTSRDSQALTQGPPQAILSCLLWKYSMGSGSPQGGTRPWWSKGSTCAQSLVKTLYR